MENETFKDLLNQKIELEAVPSKAIADFLDGSARRQIAPRKVKLRDVMTILSTPGIDASLDVINPQKIRGKVETYQLEGTAVFKQDKLVGIMHGREVSGTAIRFNDYNYAILDARCPVDEEEFFSFQLTDFQSKMKPAMREDKLIMQMDIFVEGNLIDQTCTPYLLKPDLESEVEERIASNITWYVKEGFRQAADMGADIYGIGQEVRRYYPEIWEQRREDWPDFLGQVSFEIDVDANIRRSGLIIEPTQSKNK